MRKKYNIIQGQSLENLKNGRLNEMWVVFRELISNNKINRRKRRKENPQKEAEKRFKIITYSLKRQQIFKTTICIKTT